MKKKGIRKAGAGRGIDNLERLRKLREKFGLGEYKDRELRGISARDRKGGSAYAPWPEFP